MIDSRLIFDSLIKQTIFIDIWVPMNQSKSIPNNCGYGGDENFSAYNGKLYIARVKFDNDMVSGKFVDNTKDGYCK